MTELSEALFRYEATIPNALDSRDVQEQGIGRHTARRLGALLLTGAIALGTTVAKDALFSDTAIAQTAPASAGTPQILAGQTNTLVTSVTEAWATHQLPTGQFLDPVEGRVGGYGGSMIGQAMIETGVANNDETLVQDGIEAELHEANNPNNGGFEKFSLASAYIWNQTHLASDPNWQAAQGVVSSFLRASGQATVTSGGAATCYAEQNCWDNLKLVNAYAGIELAAMGPTNQSGVAAASHEAALTSVTEKVLKQASINTGTDASRRGSGLHFGNAGILSDPTRDPLAYHELSTMLLGHVVEALGSRTPRALDAAFQRSARAILGLMAPDGDGAYIGRGQGQVWNVAAMTDALAIAAHDTSNPVWRGRYLAGVARTLTRLETVYAPGPYGLALVPRLAGDPNPNYLGVDNYANTVQYNGLALWELDDATQELQNTQTAPPESIGADTNGVFIDPSHTQFAAVRKGDLWWAIHAGDTGADARYDFGLVAAERLINGTWLPAMPYRPLTDIKTSGGPVLVSHNEHLVPVGNTITASANGVVKIDGGWSPSAGGAPSVDKNTQWVYRPAGKNGVNLSFQEKGSKNYQFQVWYEEGSKVKVTSKGLNVVEPDGRQETYLFNKSVSVLPGGLYHSAYDENLASSILTMRTKGGDNTVSYTTEF